MWKSLVCFLLLCLAGCSQKEWTDRLASAEEQRLAIETAQEFRDGAVDRLVQKAEPGLTADIQRGAAEVRPILARVKGPFSIVTVNVAKVGSGPVTKTFVLQAGSASNWALAEVVLRGPPGSLKLAGFHTWPSDSNPSKQNDFITSQHSLLGYVWLLLMGISISLCILAVVLIWRRPWLTRRWLWTLGSLLGFSSFSLNWSTGVWAVQTAHVSLLGAGAIKSGPLAPWILSFGVPVVAIIVIARWLRGRGQVTGAV